MPGVLERLFLAAAKGTQEFRSLSQSSLIGNLFYAFCAITVASLGLGVHRASPFYPRQEDRDARPDRQETAFPLHNAARAGNIAPSLN